MAKGIDQFEKFKAATLNTPALSDAIKPTSSSSEPKAAEKKEVSPTPVPAEQTKPVVINSKPALEQVSFFLDKDLKKAVGLLKYELGVQLKDLYEEAIRDLLKKYKKL